MESEKIFLSPPVAVSSLPGPLTYPKARPANQSINFGIERASPTPREYDLVDFDPPRNPSAKPALILGALTPASSAAHRSMSAIS